MTRTPTIALVGDYNPEVAAHVAIPKALTLAVRATALDVAWQWLETSDITSGACASGFSAVWCVPASPYRNMAGVLDVIQHARLNEQPHLGTCGGYQHAVLEFARNVLGHAEAGNAEVDPDCPMPVIGPLTCALVEVSGGISFAEGSKLAMIYGGGPVDEKYRCSYGVAPEYLAVFEGSALEFTGADSEGAPRAFELADHPFFVGTAYQPERSALEGQSHPLIEAFVRAVAGASST